MLEQIVKTAYKEFTLRFYHELFARFQDQETGLTAAEIFAAEAIRALGSPTVNEFADFMHVSTPNAAYKINSLVRKGYVEKTRSAQDKRDGSAFPRRSAPNSARCSRSSARSCCRWTANSPPARTARSRTDSKPPLIKTQIKKDQLQNWSVFIYVQRFLGGLSKQECQPRWEGLGLAMSPWIRKAR